MNYRFLKFATVYDDFQRRFEATLTEDDLSYSEMWQRFVDTRYGLSDYYSRHMARLGNYAQDVFASVRPLQMAWAEENGVSMVEDEDWLSEVLLAQVRAFRPDVVYLQDLYVFDRVLRDRIREASPGRVVIVGWRSAPTTDFAEMADLDLLLTAFPHYVERFANVGVNVKYMPLAFEPGIVSEVVQVEERHPFTFVGQPGSSRGVHARRHALVASLLGSTPLEIWSDFGSGPPPREVHGWRALGLAGIFEFNRLADRVGIPVSLRRGLPLVGRGIDWLNSPTDPGLSRRFPNRCHAAVYGLDQYRVLGESLVTLNSHIDASRRFATNLRLYEATGMGACLLTERQQGLERLFEPDVEVVTYGSAMECAEKVTHLLENEHERRRIAEAGQARTHRDHSFAARVAQLDEMLRELFRA